MYFAPHSAFAQRANALASRFVANDAVEAGILAPQGGAMHCASRNIILEARDRVLIIAVNYVIAVISVHHLDY